MGDGYLQIDCSDPEVAARQVTALGDDVPLDGVVAADDSGVLVAALAGTALGLDANSADAALATRDKWLMRQRLSGGEVTQPEFELLTAEDEPTTVVPYPVVVKPLDRSASQGVIRVDSPSHLGATLGRIRQIIDDETAPLLVERYLTGTEIAVEGLITNGELTVLAIFDKPDTGDGPAFPETIFVTPSLLPESVQTDATRGAESAVRALELTHGPVHIELRIHDGRPYVLEIAARSIGGLCSRSLNFGLMGTSLETLILRNALRMEKPELKRESHASGVLMIPVHRSGKLLRYEGLDQVGSINGVTGHDLTMQPGSEVLAAPKGDRYAGFVYASGTTPQLVEKALRTAMNTVSVTVQ
jgi:biotin carboxylase